MTAKEFDCRVTMRASDLTKIDSRETTLFRLIGRYGEARAEGNDEAASRYEVGFRRRLIDYEKACQ